MTCPSCGALGGVDDAQCRSCGAPLEAEIEVVLRPRSSTRTYPAVSPAGPPLTVDLAPTTGSASIVPVASTVFDPATAPLPPWAPPASSPAAPEPWRPAGLPAGPPTGPPGLPAGPAEGGRREPWKGWPAVAGGTLVVAAVAAGTALLLLHDNGDADKVGSLLQAGQTRVTDVANRAARSTKLITLRETGRVAAQDESDLASRQQDAAQIKDAGLRAKTDQLLTAQRDYLHAMSNLGRLNQAAVAERQTPVWARTKHDVGASATEIQTAQGALAKQKLPGQTRIDPAKLASTTTAVDTTVGHAHTTLVNYQLAYHRWQTANQRGIARAGIVSQYRSTVEAILTQYGNDRKTTDQFADRVDAMPKHKAAQAIAGFIRDRNATLEALASAAPQQGDTWTYGASNAHSGLSDPVSSSEDALGEAGEAVAAARVEHTPVTDQDAWQSFLDSSKDIDEQIDTAHTVWVTKVNELANTARYSGVPSRPKPPNV